MLNYNCVQIVGYNVIAPSSKHLGRCSHMFCCNWTGLTPKARAVAAAIANTPQLCIPSYLLISAILRFTLPFDSNRFSITFCVSLWTGVYSESKVWTSQLLPLRFEATIQWFPRVWIICLPCFIFSCFLCNSNVSFNPSMCFFWRDWA